MATKHKITTQEFAQILSEEFDRDNWGDINPYLFQHIAYPPDEEDDNDEEAQNLKEVLVRVLARL